MLTKSSLNKFKKKKKRKTIEKQKFPKTKRQNKKKKPVKLSPRITCTAANFIQMMHFFSQPPS